ncbi:MAG: ABC transporter permease [Bacteroidota bacterium]
MLKHSLLITLRSFARQPGYTALNIGGLTVGLAAAFLLGFAIQDELRMDQMHSDRLYSVFRSASFDGSTIETWNAAPQPMAEVMRTDFPEVEHALMLRYEGEQVLAVDDQPFWAEGYWTDSAFFEMFAFPLLAGDPATALADPDGIVLTETMASRLFGAGIAPGDLTGRAVRFNDHEARVTGVAADLPQTASMDFEWIVPASEFYSRNEWVESWDNNAMTLFVTLREGADVDAINRRMTEVLKEHSNIEDATAFARQYSSVYLRGTYENGVQAGGRIETVRIFAIIAVLLLALACINFTNLATARASRRADEIGVRKSLGATRSGLLGQFLGESVAMALIAFVAALAVFAILVGPFGTLLQKEFSVSELRLGMVVGFFGVAVASGLLAGIYPAVVLARFSPARALQGEHRGGLTLRRGLVVFQFAASVVLIVGTLAVVTQLHYLQNRDIGLDRDGLLSVALRDGAKQQYSAFRQTLLEDPAITHVGTANNNPLWMGSSTEHVDWQGKDPESSMSFWVMGIDADAIDALGMEMADGRAFSAEIASDSLRYIINEAAARRMGLQAPVGEEIALWEETGEVVGVVKDFHMRPMAAVEPTVFWLDDPETSDWVRAYVRTAPGQTEAALARLDAAFETFSPDYPLDYLFMDEEYDRMYQGERQLGTLAGGFAAIAAFIAGLGLLGLAAYAAEQRRKEVGVRRVLGASLASVVGLLTREFLVWVGLACLVALPVAYLLAERWLSQFEYRTALGAGPFVFAALAALAVGVLAAGTQAMRAALMDPVHALRSE